MYSKKEKDKAEVCRKSTLCVVLLKSIYIIFPVPSLNVISHTVWLHFLIIKMNYVIPAMNRAKEYCWKNNKLFIISVCTLF